MICIKCLCILCIKMYSKKSIWFSWTITQWFYSVKKSYHKLYHLLTVLKKKKKNDKHHHRLQNHTHIHVGLLRLFFFCFSSLFLINRSSIWLSNLVFQMTRSKRQSFYTLYWFLMVNGKFDRNFTILIHWWWWYPENRNIHFLSH